MAQIPVGLAGPVIINRSNAQGDFFVPLATTEGALVASYTRGMKACRLSGGITTVCLSEGVQRSPFLDSLQLQKRKFLWIGFKKKEAHFLRSYLKRVDTQN